VAIHPSAGLHERHRRQLAILDVFVKIVGVRDVRRANGLIGHDLLLVLKRVADVAVLVALRANLSVIEQIPIPLIVVTLP
jgi:hypothetical protein